MIKKLLISILLLLIVYLAFVFIKTEQKGESFFKHLEEKFIQITEVPQERIVYFLEERREVVEKEIEKEKEQIKEEAKETGSRIWQEVVNFILRRDAKEE